MSVWGALQELGARLVTTDLVLGEALATIGWRVSRKRAAEAGRAIYASTAFTVERPSRDDDLSALDRLETGGRDGPGFVDCVSFDVIARRGIRTAFTFDYEHFRGSGARLIPREPVEKP